MSNRIIPWALTRNALSLMALLLAPLQVAHAQDPLPINHRWVGDRILVTWACDYFQGTNMAVVVSDSGLVVIDTGLSPTTVRRQREWIEGELGRSDFRFLINTHMHNDHAFANEVFKCGYIPDLYFMRCDVIRHRFLASGVFFQVKHQAQAAGDLPADRCIEGNVLF